MQISYNLKMSKPLIIFVTIIVIYIIVQTAYSGYYLLKGWELADKTNLKDIKYENNKSKITVFVNGDSVGAGVGAASIKNTAVGRFASYLEQKHSVELINKSKSGQKMANMLETVPDKKYDVVVLIVSSNDLFHLTPISKFKQNTEKVLGIYSQKSDKVILVGPGKVYGSVVIPFPLRFIYKIQAPKYAIIIDEEAKKYKNVIHMNPIDPPPDIGPYKYTDAEDKFHPNDEGHRFWFDLIKKGFERS